MLRCARKVHDGSSYFFFIGDLESIDNLQTCIFFYYREHESTSTTSNSTDPNGVGGPLMTSVVNGARNNSTPSSQPPNESANLTNSNSGGNLLVATGGPAPSFSTFPLDNDFNLLNDIFPSSSTWDYDSPNCWSGESTAGPIGTRPESRQSVASTPRPPSAPAHSPMAQFVPQPSPTNPPTPANPYSSSFPFSPNAESNFSVEEVSKIFLISN